MEYKESFQKIFNKKSLKIVLIIYMVCCIMSFICFSVMKLISINDKITSNTLIVLGILVAIYGAVFYKCYKWVVACDSINPKALNVTKILVLTITYFQYLYLNFTMHLNSVWLIAIFFVILGALFFDLKMIIASVVLSALCIVIVFIHNPSILKYEKLASAEIYMTMVTVVITFILLLIMVYMASKLLKSISEKEAEIREENEKLLKLFKRISEISNTVLSSSENLGAAIAEQTSSLVEVSDVTNLVSQNSDEMLDKSNNNEDILHTLLNTNEGVVHKIKDSEGKINNLIGITEENQKSLNATLSIISNIKDEIANTFESTKDLEEKSAKVDEILNLIGNISEQTNLLALNASIEAARAGEYGKGFAVVADEIRKLSEDTKQSLDQASTIVSELKDKINIVQNQMKGNNKKSQEGNSIINETVNRINDMNDHLKSFSSNIIDINEASNTLFLQTKNAVKFNKEISNITKKTISQYNTVAETISQNASTCEEIEANINELKNIAEDMNKLVK
ncbi:methyl-accepting chemotaxis protein [Clostridium kluyveri]|uniref:methyl-accepting chemotaxis protein n=1 Tax=Clostridium kluyveri TaxID=1534 RepID=UPI00224591D4|nr:methyl-accepting chemotaxis protein [Clostridium kluyveri]UZQ50263.1 methyl-accepting chemotaxis protein [Clostridium kluyveri]